VLFRPLLVVTCTGNAELLRGFPPVPEIRQAASGRGRPARAARAPGRRGVRAGSGAADGEQHDDGDAVPAEQGPVPHADRASVGDLGPEGDVLGGRPAGEQCRRGRGRRRRRRTRRDGDAARAERVRRREGDEVQSLGHRRLQPPSSQAILSFRCLTACAVFYRFFLRLSLEREHCLHVLSFFSVITRTYD
jgi:hypothetical protein